jgi:hypothetical protein
MFVDLAKLLRTLACLSLAIGLALATGVGFRGRGAFGQSNHRGLEAQTSDTQPR